ENEVEVSNEDFQQIIAYNKAFNLPEIGNIQISRNNTIPYSEDTYLFEITDFDSRVADYMNELSVEVTNKLVTVSDLSIEYPVRKRGEDILNTLINKYVQSNLRDKNTIADSTIAF